MDAFPATRPQPKARGDTHSLWIVGCGNRPSRSTSHPLVVRQPATMQRRGSPPSNKRRADASVIEPASERLPGTTPRTSSSIIPDALDEDSRTAAMSSSDKNPRSNLTLISVYTVSDGYYPKTVAVLW